MTQHRFDRSEILRRLDEAQEAWENATSEKDLAYYGGLVDRFEAELDTLDAVEADPAAWGYGEGE